MTYRAIKHNKTFNPLQREFLDGEAISMQETVADSE